MVAHESQSLLLEMQVCRSRAFLGYLAPLLARDLRRRRGRLRAPTTCYRSTIRVARGFIRVDADEVTYPPHVILRYRLEQALLGGDLQVADLPGAWNEGMRELLGVAPPDDRAGLPAGHPLADGAFGYFPCYTLGAMMAAQLFEALRARPAGARRPDRRSGDFRPLLAWLRRQRPRAGLAARHPDPAHQRHRPSARRRSRSWTICRARYLG